MVNLHIPTDAGTFGRVFLAFFEFFWKNLQNSGQIKNAKNDFFHFLMIFCHFLVYLLMPTFWLF